MKIVETYVTVVKIETFYLIGHILSKKKYVYIINYNFGNMYAMVYKSFSEFRVRKFIVLVVKL